MNSVEIIIFLLALKIKYPNRITLLRGSHESRTITQAYGFYNECFKKYGSANVWRMSTDIFDLFQLAAIIENKVFCVHGGLSPSVDSIDDIRKLYRKKDIPRDGPINGLLWSNPCDSIYDSSFSTPRKGCGYLFGYDVVKKFNQENTIVLIARSHELIEKGYQFMFDDKLVTIWSAPNYYYICDNAASIMEYDEHMNRGYKIFEARPLDERILIKK